MVVVWYGPHMFHYIDRMRSIQYQLAMCFNIHISLATDIEIWIQSAEYRNDDTFVCIGQIRKMLRSFAQSNMHIIVDMRWHLIWQLISSNELECDHHECGFHGMEGSMSRVVR